MEKYTLSQDAERQLDDILQYTLDHFGEYQLRAYHLGLKNSFEQLATFPLIGRDVSTFAPDLRQYRYQSHYIFYRERGDGIFIVGLYHTARDIRPHLFE